MNYYPITPVPKPSMTHADRWKKRPCVLQYFAFKDEVRLRKVTFDSGSIITFHLPMPNSWSAKKKATMNGKPHKQTPDFDNLMKALSDSVYKDDSHISSISIRKIWAYEGGITIE